MIPSASTRFIRASLAAVCILFAQASGCRRIDNPTAPLDGATVTTTLAGRVLDESGVGLPGVSVSTPGGSATTDANGVFFIPNVSVTATRACVIAKKAGYFNGARAAVPSRHGVTYFELALASNAAVGTIDGVVGGTVSLPTGASLNLRSNGVVSSGGAAYTGSVSVSAKYLDPASPTFNNLFPGNLDAQDASGNATELQTYGVLIAELHGSSGETLQPASGKPATITIPISPA